MHITSSPCEGLVEGLPRGCKGRLTILTTEELVKSRTRRSISITGGNIAPPSRRRNLEHCHPMSMIISKAKKFARRSGGVKCTCLVNTVSTLTLFVSLLSARLPPVDSMPLGIAL